MYRRVSGTCWHCGGKLQKVMLGMECSVLFEDLTSHFEWGLGQFEPLDWSWVGHGNF